ncbi:histidinol-phosphatase [Mangrovibacterium diazotrophicum]|uniref:D,D-heptose 1,7-bisphosphate phosphatase n=1 Tax=Mangrovibacterium diazotrophicum TaxID=1261403 RepID=A0A419VYE9_9BACT|nr:histidinol-phosphatase [Mangrovibacterium diazotrophicum]RKD88267.1 D-alpha,beta-D-heptose 1,7-bisphosphate phosphatase [Mangrovibacterium diazotrophicum]
MKKVLFIDRDGTLIHETHDELVDSFEKLEFLPKVFRNMHKIKQNLDYELVIVTNQDGLGTPVFPEEKFWPVHHWMLRAFSNEGVDFDEIFIDRHYPEDNSTTRKPGTGMLTKYMNGGYDLANSYVIGDRVTDMMLARNLGTKGILINDGSLKGEINENDLDAFCVSITNDWDEIYKVVSRS